MWAFNRLPTLYGSGHSKDTFFIICGLYIQTEEYLAGLITGTWEVLLWIKTVNLVSVVVKSKLFFHISGAVFEVVFFQAALENGIFALWQLSLDREDSRYEGMLFLSCFIFPRCHKLPTKSVLKML